MEAFSLLKFWKSSSISSPLPVTPIPAADDGPFFDLEFSGAESDEEDVAEVVCVDGDGEEVEVLEESETEDVVNFSDPNLPIEEDVFKIMAVSTDNSGKPEVFPVSLLRSATKLRILMSGFKRSSKSEQARPDPKEPLQRRKRMFTIKFKPGEVPIVSLFTRDHSSRPLNGVVSSFSSSSSTSSTSSSSSSEKTNAESEQKQPSPDEKMNPKDKVQKYIKMVKPLYIRVSKKYGEKLGLSGQVSLSSKSPRPEKPPLKSREKEEEAAEKVNEKKNQGNLGVGLKVMIKRRLSGKMKSQETTPVAGKYQDELVQQHEWIQGAILHCKKSFNASPDIQTTEEKAQDDDV